MEKDTRCDTTGCVYKQTTKTILVKKKKIIKYCQPAQQVLLPLGLGIHFRCYLLSAWQTGNKMPALSTKPGGITFQLLTSHFLDQVKFYLAYPWLLGKQH